MSFQSTWKLFRRILQAWQQFPLHNIVTKFSCPSKPLSFLLYPKIFTSSREFSVDNQHALSGMWYNSLSNLSWLNQEGIFISHSWKIRGWIQTLNLGLTSEMPSKAVLFPSLLCCPQCVGLTKGHAGSPHAQKGDAAVPGLTPRYCPKERRIHPPFYLLERRILFPEPTQQASLHPFVAKTGSRIYSETIAHG